MAEDNRSLRQILASLIEFSAKALGVSMIVAIVAGVPLYATHQAVPIFNPIKMYEGVLEMKRDWPAFEKQLTASEQANHPELLAFLEETDTGTLAVIAVGFDLVLIAIALEIYLALLILAVFTWHLVDQRRASAT